MTRARTAQTPSAPTGKGSHRLRRPLVVLAGLGVLLAMASGVATGLGASPAGGSAYPRQLTDDEGTLVSVPGAPRRIISLSPSTTEIAFAVGAGDRLVAGTDADDYPAQAAGLPDVVSLTKVLTEQIVALVPDLILASGNGLTPAADIARLRELGYPVLVVYPATVDAALADIRLIGEAVGEPEAADQVATETAQRLATVAAAAHATGSSPRTFYELCYCPDIYGPVPGSVYADEIELAGGDPVTTADPSVNSIPLERLVEADPEVIVLGDAQYGTCPAEVLARPGWGGITAVRTGAVRPAYDTIITRPGPRLADGLASLARAIHPELELPGFAADPPMCAGAPDGSAAP